MKRSEDLVQNARKRAATEPLSKEEYEREMQHVNRQNDTRQFPAVITNLSGNKDSGQLGGTLTKNMEGRIKIAEGSDIEGSIGLLGSEENDRDFSGPIVISAGSQKHIFQRAPAGDNMEAECSLDVVAVCVKTAVKQEACMEQHMVEIVDDSVAAHVSEQLMFNMMESQTQSPGMGDSDVISVPLTLPSAGVATSNVGSPFYTGAPNFTAANYLSFSSSANPFIYRQQKVRRDLSLLDKIRLIQRYDTTGKSQRALAAEFDISVGSVNNILRRKKEYLDAYKDNPKTDFTASTKSFRRAPCVVKGNPSLVELNNYIVKWAELAVKNKVPVAASAIQEKARDFARRIRLNNFTAPLSWLEGLKMHYNLQICADADLNTNLGSKITSSWSKMLPFLVQGYEPENVFTCGETTLFYNALPDKCFISGGACLGSHHSVNIEDHRVTVLLCCSAAGEKLAPFVVCHSDQGNSLTSDDVPVGFRQSDHAFVTPVLFAEWLKQLDSILEQQNRRIALFMEMTPPHLGGQVLKNVSPKFYLDGSAQFLQPLHLGIFTMFRAHFRKRFLQSVLAKAQDCDDIPSLLKSVGLIDALHWIKSAWDRVKPATVVSCFQAVSFATEHPGDEVPDVIPPTLLELVEETGQTLKFTPMRTEVYLQFDSHFAWYRSELTVWEKQLLTESLAQLGCLSSDHEHKSSMLAGHSRQSVDSDQGSGDVGMVVSQTEALTCLDRLKQFARSDSQLLDMLYAAEELLLDHITYKRRMTQLHGVPVASFPQPPSKPNLTDYEMPGQSTSNIRVPGMHGLPPRASPSDFGLQG